MTSDAKISATVKVTIGSTIAKVTLFATDFKKMLSCRSLA